MSYTPISEWSDDDKPREKLIKWGAETLSDSELLGILISTGSRGKSAITLAKELLATADYDINSLARFGKEEITQVKGLGIAKAVTIMAALELGKRRQTNKIEKPIIESVHDAVDILRPILQDKTQEYFYAILLSRRNQVLKTSQISKGGITKVIVDPRIILKDAILHHASGIILAHNHPSGSIKPSLSDVQLTQKLQKAAELMDIEILDHIIIAGDNFYSFSEDGKIHSS